MTDPTKEELLEVLKKIAAIRVSDGGEYYSLKYAVRIAREVVEKTKVNMPQRRVEHAQRTRSLNCR